MAKLFAQLIAALLSLSVIANAKGITRNKRGAVTCICITVDCSCSPSFPNQFAPQPYLPSQLPPLAPYPAPSQPTACVDNCLRGCAQAQQRCQLSCQQSCGQSIGGPYGPVPGPVYNEPVYLAPGTTEAPQYIPQNPSYPLPYAPSGALISPGAPVNAPTVCVEICMPSCSAQCLQQQQQPIPVVQPSPLPFGPAGPGPVVEPLPGPIMQPTPEPITNAPPYQPPYIQQPTPAVSASAGSTICIAVCMPSCSADCLQQNPVVPAYTPTPPYLPQPPFPTPVPSVTPFPPYQTVTPTPIPVVQQTPASVTCVQVCMPSCSAQCIDQQRPQPLPYVPPQPVPAPVVPPRPLLPQPIVPQPVEVTLPQSIQSSPNCVALCQNACVQQCSQQNLGISQCSSPCSSTCSQSCPVPQPTVPIRPLVTTPSPFIPLTEPMPFTQPPPVPQPLPSLPTTQCQPSPGGLSKCSCPSGFIVCISVSGSNQCCRKRK